MAGFSTFSLEPYAGEWTADHAAHLLRRTMYAPLRVDIQEASSVGLQGTLELLTGDMPAADPPLNFNYEDDPNVAIGESWVGQPYVRSETANMQIASRLQSLRAWTLGQAIQEGMSIREKMTLFWHNHFVTGDIRDANFAYRNIKLYRDNFLGNFREITKATTIDPAMLRYLNGNQNTKNRPNENYARELLELFTIGKGPSAGEGDYTNYTEHDVAELSKILTGWHDLGYFNRNGFDPDSFFLPQSHDTSTKQLSHRFGYVQIPDMGGEEYSHLIDIIFQQEEVARFIARKIYRWFVYYVIDEQVEQGIIQPMAQILRDNDYEMKPMVHALLSSAHFYDDYAKGSLIKNPIDFIVGQIKHFALDFGSNLTQEYRIWVRLANFAELLQMDYFTPPNVAGWKAYYQEPLYYRTWINSSTLSSRYLFTNLFLTGVRADRLRIEADVFAMIEGIENANDPNALIDGAVSLLLPKDIDQAQKDYLKSILIPGLPDYEWTLEYDLYLSNPDDNELKTAVANRLKAMFSGLLSLPEYQLS